MVSVAERFALWDEAKVASGTFPAADRSVTSSSNVQAEPAVAASASMKAAVRPASLRAIAQVPLNAMLPLAERRASASPSVKTTSPSDAKLAATPPIVGFVRTEINSPPASWKRASAADVLAICMRERIPSCMRAPPPDPDTMMSGRSCS